MKQCNVFLLISCFALPLNSGLCQTYVPLQIQEQHQTRIVPFGTAFPLEGDQSIIGRQMVAAVDNYLREYRHLTIETSGLKQPIILKYVRNDKKSNSGSIVSLSAATPIVVGAIGLNAIKGLLPQIDQQKAILLFPLEGDTKLRQDKRENIIYFRPLYDKELQALVDYTINTKHKAAVAIIYEASNWGNNLLNSLTKILADKGITPIAMASYAQGTVETEDAAKIIYKSSPNVVFCLAQPRPAYSFISNVLNDGLHECLFVGISQLAVMQKLLKINRGVDLVVTSVVPPVKNDSIPMIAEYKKTMQSFLLHHDDSPFFLEAFIMMTLLEECLKKITGPITIPAIIKSCESFNNVNFKGIQISFNQSDRSLSSSVWVNPGIDQNWIAY